jgi:hypothetical protein
MDAIAEIVQRTAPAELPAPARTIIEAAQAR